uniref:Uncharacterized protein n=1 Tax=Rhizophora mucronata TaxID=61149 RepID=A0A2P2NKY7_RHIMU
MKCIFTIRPTLIIFIRSLGVWLAAICWMNYAVEHFNLLL